MTLFPSPISILRRSGGYNARGIWEDNADTPVTILGSVQPLTAREIMALDVADTDVGMVWVYTDSTLAVSTKETSNSGDIVLWNGAKYEIVSRDPFTNGLIPHVRYRAQYRDLQA